MKYLSTRNKNIRKTFIEAAAAGIAEEGGLYFPESIPVLDNSFWRSLKKQSFIETANIVLSKFIDKREINLSEAIEKSFNFPLEVKQLDDKLFILELFHGPSNAFKDFGARFLASVLNDYANRRGEKITILVATSGDTGSAVGRAFYGADNIDLYLLYPSGKISNIQEKQLTTIGGNVTALEIKGTFDDCQALVKKAFSDMELRKKINLSSANSINIARLLPQILYYYEAFKRIDDNKNIILSVPSGNLGNLTGALIALKTGLPLRGIISALNVNDVFDEFLRTGHYNPKRATPTLSNAMDVGAPNNLERIKFMFGNDLDALRKTIATTSITDKETAGTIDFVFDRYDYVICPHTAVAFASLEKLRSNFSPQAVSIIMATAHPAKFMNIYNDEIKTIIDVPKQLSGVLGKEKKSVLLSNRYEAFKEYLFSTF